MMRAATKRQSDEATTGASVSVRTFPPSSLRSSVAPSLSSPHCRGFTLIEVLIVIGIIILMVALAIPAFSIFRGERSTEAAENQLSAMMARARTESIGFQRAGGVLFFRDPREPDRVSVAQVWQSDVAPTGGTKEVYLDLVPDREFLVLPAGVGIQVVDDCFIDETPNPPKRQDDGYLGFNSECHWGGSAGSVELAQIEIGGCVLFDASGRLMCVSYGFHIRDTGSNGPPTPLGDLLYYNPDPNAVPNPRVPANKEYVDPGLPLVDKAGNPPIRSQFGLVAYDRVAFDIAFPNADADPQMKGLIGNAYTSSTEPAEEDWIDKNGVPLLVNRYNGTITRGQ